MTPTAILLEVQKLNDVSARLDYFAGQHPAASEGLLAISSHVRNSATTIGSAGHDENSAALGTAIDRANL